MGLQRSAFCVQSPVPSPRSPALSLEPSAFSVPRSASSVLRPVPSPQSPAPPALSLQRSASCYPLLVTAKQRCRRRRHIYSRRSRHHHPRAKGPSNLRTLRPGGPVKPENLSASVRLFGLLPDYICREAERPGCRFPPFPPGAHPWKGKTEISSCHVELRFSGAPKRKTKTKTPEERPVRNHGGNMDSPWLL